MADSEAFDYLISKLKEQRDVMVGSLAEGRMKNMEEYSNVCGFLRGLDFSVNQIDEILKKLAESNDE